MLKANVNWSAKQISKAIENGTIKFNNPIQRGYVWDIKRQSLLIDSMFRGYPIPATFAIRTDEKITVKGKEVSVYDCIDGKQRFTTVTRYLNDEFALSGLEPIEYEDGTSYDLNGKTFSELDEDIQENVSSYVFTMYYFSDATEEEIAEMMSRLNNGKVLTGIENARIKAKQLDTIKGMASHKLLMDNLSATAIKGYANEDIIIKLALLLNDQCELSTKNVRQAYETFTFGENTVNEINSILDFTYLAIEAATDDKKIIKRITSKANLITVLYVAKQFMDESDESEEDKVSIYGDKLSAFFDGTDGATVSADYNEASQNATMRASNVITRNDELYEFVMEG